jgi:hypothetical protein
MEIMNNWTLCTEILDLAVQTYLAKQIITWAYAGKETKNLFNERKRKPMVTEKDFAPT